MKILGIDPGYGITGFGLIDAQRGQYRLLGCGAITTPPNTDFPWRLEVIYNDMTRLLQTAQPEAVAIDFHTVSGQLRSDVTNSPDAPAVWKLETVSGNADIFLMQ